ncbi:hypothetical protein [Paraburkholderia nodosa]|uniref:hypothetical protein n=1 Tax=Paraburkholderia nodosa TaxID=392320 RepID=UPI00114D3796|nr:hypothetical protein [Paraburkholderia nodosa]
MPTPLQAMADWFEAQPEEVQTHSGFLMYYGISQLTGSKDFEFGDRPDQAFLEWLRAPSNSSYAELAKTLLAREHIRFTMIDGLCTQKNWDDARVSNQWLLDSLADHPDRERMKDLPLKIIEDIPRRSAVFIKSGNAWRENVASHVSDDAIKKWHDAAAAKEIRERPQPEIISEGNVE